ncbi:ABC transporter ATP-binding protein [Psychromonas sp. PT13]|uniref:ABC transporter ATP-binding protein n=1 Tax=Psychromonas sp. PT13 TaxID=3439547 RepID=UPI003EBA8927
METVIDAKGIKKVYKISKRAKGLFGHIANLFYPQYTYKHAIDNINLTIKKGDAVGFIGANGAGKSTTIKILSGILSPTEGSVTALNVSPHKQRKQYVAQIGAVFGQKSQLAWDLPIIDSFHLLQKIYRIPEDKFQKNLAQFTKILDMQSFIEQPVRQLSLGQRMRADIAASLLHSPELVFFDEPTIGLDVVAKERIRAFIRYMNKELGVTIIFTTHDMQDIEKTCDKLIIIDKGKKIYDGTVNGIKNHFGSERKLIVQFSEEHQIAEIPNVQIKHNNAISKEFLFKSKDVPIKSLIQHIFENYHVQDLTISEPDIEEIVRDIYEKGV